MPPIRIVRVKDALDLLQISKASFYRRVREGDLALTHVGPHSSGVTEAELARFIAAGTQEVRA